MEAVAAAAAAARGAVCEDTRGRAAEENCAARAESPHAPPAPVKHQAPAPQHAVQHAAQQIVEQHVANHEEQQSAGEATGAGGTAHARCNGALAARIGSRASAPQHAAQHELQQQVQQHDEQHEEHEHGGAVSVGGAERGEMYRTRAVRGSTLAARATELLAEAEPRANVQAEQRPLQLVVHSATRRPSDASSGARGLVAVRQADRRQAAVQGKRKATHETMGAERAAHEQVAVKAVDAERRRAEYILQRKAAREVVKPPPWGRICLDARVSYVAPDGAMVEGNDRCGGECEIADSPFGVQAAVLEALAEDSCDRNAYQSGGFRQRVRALRRCDQRLDASERATLAAAMAGISSAWAAWNDNATKGVVTTGLCPIAGNGLFAECDMAYNGNEPPWECLRGVVVCTPPDKADIQSTVDLKGAAAEGLVASLLGPLALANAGCALCASLRFCGLGWRLGCTSLTARQVRAVVKGEQLCVYYKPQQPGIRCVLCSEPIH